VRSIAFPSISTGAYRFPIDRAARIAVDAARAHAVSAAPLSVIRFVCFSDGDLAVYETLLAVD
jgi:O-acetyl-ADP-ribose deacetylase (regulator of RNase III)